MSLNLIMLYFSLNTTSKIPAASCVYNESTNTNTNTNTKFFIVNYDAQ